MTPEPTTSLETLAAETRRLQREAAYINAEADRLRAENSKLMAEHLRRSLEFERRYAWLPYVAGLGVGALVAAAISAVILLR